MSSTLDSLLNTLKELHFEPKIEKESGQPYLLVSILGVQVPLFFALLNQNSSLQLIVYLPLEIEPSRSGEIARLLHLINKEIDMPGFGMDEQAKRIFYRLVLPYLDAPWNKKILRQAIDTANHVCSAFLEAISIIVKGKTTFEEILKNR